MPTGYFCVETGSNKALPHIFIYGDFLPMEITIIKIVVADGQICLCLHAAKTFGLNYICEPGMLSHCRISANAVIYDMRKMSQ